MNPLREYSRSRTLRLAAALALSLLSGHLAFALDPAKALQQYYCQSWTRQNGLPVNGIKAITQAKDGYLWLGTAAGLLRFDGTEFTLIDLASVPGIRGTIVTSMANANDDGLWVGLQDGAFGYYGGGSFSPRGKAAWGGLSLDVRSVMEAKDGTMWLAAQREAARITRAGNYEPVLTSTADLQVNILFHFADSHGRHWIATAAQGLYYWFDGKLVRFHDPIVVTTLGMAEDPEGNIWIGGPAGLLCYDSNLRRQEVPPLAAEIRTLFIDRRGILWIGTDGAGLVRYQYGAYSFLRKSDGLASDYVTTLTEDSEGDLWVGTSGGLSQLRDVKFAAENPAEDPSADVAAAVCSSARGGAWVAGRAGVTYYDGTTRQTYSTQAGLPAAVVKRVFEAANGDVYLVSGLTNLAILSGEKVAAIHAAAPYLIVGMVEDTKSVVVSVGGSLYRASKEAITPYAFAGAPPDFKWIFNLAPGRDGAFWVASERGIFRVKDGAFQRWSTPEGLPEPITYTIMMDSDGTVWASTPSGVVRLKDNKICVIRRKDGLFDDNIYAIVPDDLGNFWIDSGRGIYRVSRQAMNDFADGRIGRVESLAFNGPDSVTTADKTNSQERVGCKSLDGRIWFPSAKGVVIIDPAHIPTNRVPPAVHLDRILANGVAVDRTTPALVPPGKGELEVHFTALSFAAPQRVKIRYQLEGYDKDWIETENRREAFYTNLRPGHYLFRVTAANGDGVWNTNGPSLAIVLQPYFYQTGWFAGLVVVGLAGLGFGTYSWRTTALRWRNEQLERRIAERTAELAKSYDELKQAQSVLLETSRLAGIAEMATGVLHNLGNALNSVNTTVNLTTDRLQKSKVTALGKVVQLLEEQHGRLAEFFSADQRGQQLPGYLAQLSGHLLAERAELLRELEALQQNVDHIKEIVAAQQSYVRVSGITEVVPASELVEYGLRISEASLQRHDVAVVREFLPAPPVKVERQKVLQILVNLIRNAKEAINEGGRPDKRLVLGVRVSAEGRVQIDVTDNGVGIAAQNLTRVFAFGYTTKKAGHGFGLHSSALAAKEMGGSLEARSDGPGQGATFILELPPAS